VSKAIMMSHYNQPLSEINKMRIDDVIFFLSLKEAEDQFEQQEMKKAQKKIKSQKPRFRK